MLIEKLEKIINRMNSQMLIGHWRPRRIHYEQVLKEVRQILEEEKKKDPNDNRVRHLEVT